MDQISKTNRNVFKNLEKFEYKRTAIEAIGLYIAYEIFFFLFVILISGIVSTVSNGTGNDYNLGVKTGKICAIIFCLIFSFLVVKKKNMLTSFKGLFVILLSGILSVLLGSLGGLIPIAYLTTVSTENQQPYQ